jgi:molecular chaperone HscA
MGAALQAYNLTHKDSSGLLLDVTPLSLGIEMMGGMVEKIILRNSSIPASASKEFTTYKDGQTGMKFHILQGERELAQDCRSLANFEIKNIPPLKAGIARVKTTFTLDADGLLTIKAVEQITKQVQEIEIKPSFGLSDGEIKNMLLESMQSAKEDISKRLLVESRVESERNILAIKAALKEDSNLLTIDEINNISTQIVNLETVLESGNRDGISREAKKLEELTKEFASRKMNRDIGKAIKNTKVDQF